MFKDQYLNIDNLISTPNVLKLFRVVEAHGGVLRFVGGAVRDAIAGIKGLTWIWQRIYLRTNWSKPVRKTDCAPFLSALNSELSAC